MHVLTRLFAMTLFAASLLGCASKYTEMDTVEYVDIDRFMGPWYVIANIPTFLERDAYNAVENYTLNADGTIATIFTFRKGSVDGKQKEYRPKGFVLDSESNALWGMRFVWPIKADYRIVYVADDYSTTIVARQNRDFVWIMARTSTVSDQDYEQLVSFVEAIGYDVSKLKRVPQQW